MGRIVTLDEVDGLRGMYRAWAYNALDVTGTREIVDVLLPRLSPAQDQTYRFELACCSPALAMMHRGVLVDTERRGAALKELRRDLKKQTREVNKLPEVKDVWDGVELVTGICTQSTRKDKRHKWPRGEPDETRKCECCGQARQRAAPFNPASHDQTAHLFHDIHGLPRQRNKKRKFSVDEEVIERIGRKWKRFAGLCAAILDYRGTVKQIGFLNAKLSPDGRMCSSFNVGQAWSGRWSSSKNPFGLGTNLQNIAEKHRYIFVADPGMVMGYADLEQAESCVVAYAAEDPAYIEAHLSGDVHTFVARLLWPDLPWTGDMAEDKLVAKTFPPWDKDHTYRDTGKHIQHGLNYGLTPQGLAAYAHIPLAEAVKVYRLYFSMFPFVQARQRTIRKAVEAQQALVNPLGRRCRLFGRPWDEHTAKQGFAFIPQSTVADVLDLAIWRCWRDLDPDRVQLLAQVHDAILFQYARGDNEAVRAVAERMTIPIPIGPRVMTIPVEVQVGANWGHKSKDNPLGLEVWNS